MKKAKLFFLLVIVLLIDSSCEKRVFGTIQFKGVIIDWFTNKPIETKIELRAAPRRDLASISKLIELGTYFNKSDGSFEIKDKSVKSDKYFLQISSMQMDSIHKMPLQFLKIVELKNRGTKDFGEILEMPHSFVCRINIKHNKANNYELMISTNSLIKIKSDTVINVSFMLNREAYESSQRKLFIDYIINTDPSGFNSTGSEYILVDIDKSDYVETTINF